MIGVEIRGYCTFEPTRFVTGGAPQPIPTLKLPDIFGSDVYMVHDLFVEIVAHEMYLFFGPNANS